MIQGTIIRGTTPKHDFELPYPIELVNDIRIIYGQKKQPVVIKRIEDCQMADGIVSVALTEQDTLAFNASKQIEIELKVKLTNGKVVRNEDPIILRVIDTCDNEVM